MSRGVQNYLEEHLPYEVSMMEHTLERLAHTKNKADWNAFLESFCIHARNLKMFITNDRGGGSTGVIARDFVEFNKRTDSNLTGAFQRLNEQTAHLSKKRTVDPTKKFTIEDARNIYKWLTPAITYF
jgi:hypothetical protein